MRSSRLALLVLPLAVVGLGGCVAGYGGGGVGVAYDAAWGDPYWGWYGDYYYPGTGIYVYDRGHHRHAWSDEQRAYWQNRTQGWHGPRTQMRTNWHDFRAQGTATGSRRHR